ncbi:hypothetical protein acdb102_44560 [Acidothermaceae bacterium B102]|nr:hypothetical protein acdb102_44560 [Acidothermaceae bacterium B102]
MLPSAPPGAAMKYVLRYESPDDLDMGQIRAHFPAHQARWALFREQGTLLLIGPFADPQQGALAVFTTQESAEAFASTDPLVLNGLVAHWTVTPWREALLEPL